MRVLIVSKAFHFLENMSIFNPELDYCGIVAEDIEAAKKALLTLGLSQDLIYPDSELKACVERFDFDYIFLIQTIRHNDIYQLVSYGVPTEKIINFISLSTKEPFTIELPLRYFKEHAQEIEIIATGDSVISEGLDITKFQRKLCKFAKPSQDLYYQYKIMQQAILYGGGA